MMVDFRYNKGEKAELQAILTAVRKLMRKMKFVAVITASSQGTSNKILRKNRFFEYGKRKMDVVSTFPMEDNSNPDKEHDRILVSFADSDTDFYYGDNKW